MRKVLALLLIVGFLVAGTLVMAEIEENSFEDLDFTDEYIDGFGDPTPCGGGGGGDGGIPG